MNHVPYANAIGSLIYAMVCTRPDLSHAVSMVSSHMHDLGRGSLRGSEMDSMVHQKYHKCWSGIQEEFYR